MIAKFLQKSAVSVIPWTVILSNSTAHVGARQRLMACSQDGRISIGKDIPHKRMNGISMQFMYRVVLRDKVNRQAITEEITTKLPIIPTSAMKK